MLMELNGKKTLKVNPYFISNVTSPGVSFVQEAPWIKGWYMQPNIFSIARSGSTICSLYIFHAKPGARISLSHSVPPFLNPQQSISIELMKCCSAKDHAVSGTPHADITELILCSGAKNALAVVSAS